MSKITQKKLSILVLMFFVLTSLSNINVQADKVSDYEVGVTNLNGTANNSAKIWDVLKSPEIGWKRYDDKHPLIAKTNILEAVEARYYKGSSSYQATNVPFTVEFTFYGTQIRLLSSTNGGYSNGINIEIDGVKETFSQQSTFEAQRLVYQKLNLSKGLHHVKIYNGSSGFFHLDAVDIDSNGNLGKDIPIESIKLDKYEIELIEGSQDKLTATVLPEQTTNKNVIWSSSDESIATVDQEGNVTAIKSGEAIITAKVDGTDLSDRSKFIVKAPELDYNAILSITMVNGITKEYDISSTVLNQYLKWYENSQGTSTFKFPKKLSPYKKVTEYIVHDKIASFEVREY